jgi:phosphatidylserine/phosphatidylglycerophosphate/cardiolipin synthase-like enzyme
LAPQGPPPAFTLLGCQVGDGERVLVTSSNLTARGVTENVEVGVILHDSSLASTLIDHFRALLAAGHLAPVAE